MKIPKPIQDLINVFERLPGIGPKTAQRLTFHLLHFPQEELEKMGEAFAGLKKGTQFCEICKNIDENAVCSVCSDPSRDSNKILVVTSPLDVYALEKVGYKGRYHVLHGVINPLENIGPDEIFIGELIQRLHKLQSGELSDLEKIHNGKIMPDDEEGGQIEVILATNSSMEGESTAMYISKLIRDEGFSEDAVKITRIARGLPVGGDIEYADDITLTRALEGRGTF